ncbi:hypothetical protein [Parafrankia sp. EUN1f]|uniref:hypothetical protein n=1 Tax=Parafrankia sp. EUN1f TaxID=102897 RepID=UPI0001C46322|nr:hypothetical protein [Parafrankia sp. EUN1f]EFC81585.1 hypothetical protein FrEUN1fDRAFT_5296 [Parafrankia sp. EUN1f]
MSTDITTTGAINTTGAAAGARPRSTTGAGRGWRTDPRAIERQVRACPDVIRLAGRPAEAVRVLPDAVVVAVVCRYGPTMTELANQVRSAVLIATPETRRVDVVIADLDVDLPGWPSPTCGARHHTAPTTVTNRDESCGEPARSASAGRGSQPSVQRPAGRRVEGFSHAGSGS